VLFNEDVRGAVIALALATSANIALHAISKLEHRDMAVQVPSSAVWTPRSVLVWVNPFSTPHLQFPVLRSLLYLHVWHAPAITYHQRLGQPGGA
jgi:hypothetical protein